MRDIKNIKGMSKTGTTHYHPQLGLQVRAIKELVVCWMLLNRVFGQKKEIIQLFIFQSLIKLNVLGNNKLGWVW